MQVLEEFNLSEGDIVRVLVWGEFNLSEGDIVRGHLLESSS
ncbi:hypothetical protein [Cohnella sp. REN36]|nr:hypothetical protein [Cohnella sp. REN36]